MSTYWLNGVLTDTTDVATDGGDPVLSVTFADRTERVYCPDPDEYMITADVAKKASELGATIIAYGAWCEATQDAKSYGKKLGVTIMKYAAFFAYLRRKGVQFSDD